MKDIVNHAEHCRLCQGTGTRGSGSDKDECYLCRGTGSQTVRVDEK